MESRPIFSGISEISKLNLPNLSKLKKVITKIPIETYDISLKLDQCKNALDFK